MLLVTLPSLANDVEQHLRDQYQNKTLILRGFYSGKHLQYDSTGALTRNSKAGDWTTDGFIRINEINFSHNRIALKSDRLTIADDYRNGFQFQSKHAHTDIELDLAADNSSPQQVDAAMARIFLTSQDDFAELVPDYWKHCVAIAETGKGGNCRFPPEILSIPGLTRLAANSTSDSLPKTPPLCIGKGANCAGKTSPPRPIRHTDPEFSERARRDRFQGVVTVGLVVDTDGRPTHIQILNPLGYGLDAKAVEAVKNWTFEPGERDGHPVPVYLAIEVEFHLY